MATVDLSITATIKVKCSKRDAIKYLEEGEITESLEQKVDKHRDKIISFLEGLTNEAVEDIEVEISDTDPDA